VQPPRKLASRRSKYYVLGFVGRGQFGSVYCGIDRRSGEMVALKDADSLRLTTQSFLRELRFLAMSRHPNIVTWRTCEHFQEGRYIVMDYCEGGTLRSLMEQRILKLPCILGIVRDILAGLGHIHSHGLIHCDLKPENILLRCHAEGWQAHLSDFGIARLLEETLMNVDTLDAMAGSPAYMAPERFNGEVRVESDLYAVGIILHELLLGHRPFSGTPAALIEAHCHQSLKLSAQLPLALRSILQLSLHKDPEQRFRSAQQMQQAIEQLLKFHLDGDLAISLPTLTPAFPPASPPTIKPLLENLPHPIEQIWQQGQQIHCLSGNQLYSLGSTDPSTVSSTINPTLSTTMPEFSQFLGQGHQGQMLFVTDRALGQMTGEGASRTWQVLQQLAPETQVALDASGRWLAMVGQHDGQATLEICAVHPWRSQHRVSLPQGILPWRLLFLSPRHVGVVFHREEGTAIALFNRRGEQLGELAIPLRLVRLQTTTHAYQLLALEPDLGPMVLQLNLKPFSLTRIPLSQSHSPKHVVTTSWGHLLGYAGGDRLGSDRLGSDRAGRIDYMDPSGHCLQTFPWPQGMTAMAAQGPAQLLIASPSERGFGLYQLSLSEV
jgi:serine/threonine protein kinase